MNISKRLKTGGQASLDEKDQRIVEYVVANPHASVDLISREIGIPESTVQKRLSNLFQESYLERIIRVVEWAAIGYPLNYWIDIKINLRQLQAGRGGPIGEKSKIDSQKKLAWYIMHTLPNQYRGSLIVQDVIILLGSPADLSVAIRAKDHYTVLEFVTGGLRNLGGVESTTTFHAAWSSSEGDLGQSKELG